MRILSMMRYPWHIIFFVLMTVGVAGGVDDAARLP